MTDIIEIIPTPSQLVFAKEEAKKIGVLNNSILEGKGNAHGILGEIIVADYINADRANTYDYDLVRNGRTIDVKTKQCTSKPDPSYYCSVANYNTSQDCEVYGFVRILKDFSKCWILGGIKREDFKMEQGLDTIGEHFISVTYSSEHFKKDFAFYVKV